MNAHQFSILRSTLPVFFGFHIFIIANIHIVMLLIMTPCSLVCTHQSFGKCNTYVFRKYKYPLNYKTIIL